MKKLIEIEDLDINTLKSLLKGIVEDCLDEKFPKSEIKTKAEPRLINIKEVAALLGKSVATVHAYKRNGWIPFKKIGRSLFFDPNEVLTAMRNFNQITNQKKY